MLTFTVYGVPQAKGNMKAFLPRGMKFPIVTESNRNVRSWSQLVAEGASHALRDHAGGRLVEGPVRLSAAFYLPRPKKYHRRGVSVAHQSRPDLDKLLRCVLDALTEVVWPDDSHVVELLGLKQYAEVDGAPHVIIRVEATTGVHPRTVPPVPSPLFHLET